MEREKQWMNEEIYQERNKTEYGKEGEREGLAKKGMEDKRNKETKGGGKRAGEAVGE